MRRWNQSAVLWLAELGKKFLRLFPREDGQGVGRQRERWLQRDKLGPSDSLCTGGWHPAMVWETHLYHMTFPQTL